MVYVGGLGLADEKLKGLTCASDNTQVNSRHSYSVQWQQISNLGVIRLKKEKLGANDFGGGKMRATPSILLHNTKIYH